MAYREQTLSRRKTWWKTFDTQLPLNNSYSNKKKITRTNKFENNTRNVKEKLHCAKKKTKWLWNDRRERILVNRDGMIFNCNRQRGALETL